MVFNPHLFPRCITTMDFEDILKDVGGFGLYQKILVVVFLIPSFVVIPWFSMNLIFMSNTPEHWCYVPEVANSNLTLNRQKELIRPPHDPRCSMHDVNYSEILSYGNLTVDRGQQKNAQRDGSMTQRNTMQLLSQE